MDYDKLVKLIVDEVYKKIQESSNITVNKEEKKKAVVLWEKDLNRYKLLEKDYDIVQFNETVRDCEIVIVSRLCLRGIANLALGANVSNEERFILKMLMLGKKVYVMEDGLEYRRYKSTAPKAIYNKYIGFEEEIKKFGIQVISDIVNIIPKNRANNESLDSVPIISVNGEDTINLLNKKLITESDLRKPHINGGKNLVISKNSIITPLATDYIRIHHLNVTRA